VDYDYKYTYRADCPSQRLGITMVVQRQDPVYGRMGRRESDVPVCRMMVRKALLFGDGEMARQILAVDEVSSASMGPVKSLGRLVQGEMCFVHISDEKLDFWLDREKGGSWRQVAADVDNP